jgi:outer membrane protein
MTTGNKITLKAGILFAALLAATLPAQAQPAATKIGYVNIQVLMDESNTSKQAVKELEAEFKRREAEIAKGPANQADRRRAALGEDMALKRDEALKRLLNRANAEIKRIAEAENFDIVVLEANFAAPRVDLTARVIKVLDAKR